MKIYLVRHGITDCNINKICYGFYDSPINALGEKQAENIGSYFSKIKIDKIISSTLLRADRTANIINSFKKVPHEKYKDLNEIYYGDWENKPISNIVLENPKESLLWITDPLNTKIPNGENFIDFYTRVTKCFDKIVAENLDMDIMIVGHSGSIGCILCHTLGLSPNGFWRLRIHHNSFSKLLYDKNSYFLDRLNHPVNTYE